METPSGELYTVGYTETSGGGSKDMFIFRSTAEGDFIFQRTFGALEDEVAASVAVTSNGFVIAGRTNSFGQGGNDVLIVRTDSVCGPLFQVFGEEFDPVEIEAASHLLHFNLSPNPASSSTRLTSRHRLTSAHLIDTQGRLVRAWSGPVPEELDLRGLSAGTYQLVTMGARDTRSSQPLIIVAP